MTEFSFTPAVLQRIPALVARGYDVDQIITVLGCARGSLISICSKHRIDLKPPEERFAELATIEDCRRRRGRDATWLQMGVADDARSLLGREAERRGGTAEELGACVLELVARDGLFGAVLDR